MGRRSAWITSRSKDGGLGRRSDQERIVYGAATGACRLQAPAGYKVPPHTHPTTERVTVISGSFHLGMGEKFDETAGPELSPGSFAVLPAGMAHFAWSTGESVVQIQSEGPFQIKYVNPADDPRKAKK